LTHWSWAPWKLYYYHQIDGYCYRCPPALRRLRGGIDSRPLTTTIPWACCIAVVAAAVVAGDGDVVSEVVVKMIPYYSEEEDASQKGVVVIEVGRRVFAGPPRLLLRAGDAAAGVREFLKQEWVRMDHQEYHVHHSTQEVAEEGIAGHWTGRCETMTTRMGAHLLFDHQERVDFGTQEEMKTIHDCYFLNETTTIAVAVAVAEHDTTCWN
jgi:hypothetical protein